MSNRGVSKNRIIIDIRRIARVLNHSPSSVEYKRLGRYNVRTVQRKFNISWREIIDSSGLQYTPRTSNRIPPTDELTRDLIRVARKLDHPPTRSEYQAHGKFDSETVRRRSGKRNWEDAVASLTDFNPEQIKQQQQKGGCYYSTQEWLNRLWKLSEELGHAPTTREANEGGINAYQLCQRVGGKWVDVLKAARIDLRRRSRQAILMSTPNAELIADVVRVSRRLGRAPTMREYSSSGRYSRSMVSRRLGGWHKVTKIISQRFGPARPQWIDAADLEHLTSS